MAIKESERESWRNDVWGLQAGAPVFSPFLRTLTVVLGGVWGSGFKPSWYMTDSDTGDDPQRLVRTWILIPCTTLMARVNLSLEHVRNRIRHAPYDCHIHGPNHSCRFAG